MEIGNHLKTTHILKKNNMRKTLSEYSINNLKGVHPKLVEIIEKGISSSPFYYVVYLGVIDRDYQYMLYSYGRNIENTKFYTDKDGFKKKSVFQLDKDTKYGHGVQLVIFNPSSPNYIDYSEEKQLELGEYLVKFAKAMGVILDYRVTIRGLEVFFGI